MLDEYKSGEKRYTNQELNAVGLGVLGSKI